MKRILFTIIVFSSLISSAQTVIVEEKYEKKNEPVDFKYLPMTKKFVIMKGKTIPMGVAPFIYNVFSYDVNANKESIVENDELMEMTYSITENSFKAFDLSKLRFSAKYDYKYFLNNQHVKTIVFADLKDIGDFHFGTTNFDNRTDYHGGRKTFSHFSNSFNDFYELGLTNQKGKENINFEKDDLYLEVFDIQNNSKKRFSIEKPDLSLLKGSSYTKFDRDIHFNFRLNGNKDFDLIAKSLSSDSKTTILYKSTYDFNGKKIKDVVFNLTLDNKFFIYSDNFGGFIFYNVADNGLAFASYDALSLNNFYKDEDNGDVYIYGIFSNSTSEKASGFYVFKFDKDGNKLWSSINEIDDKQHLERVAQKFKLQVSLFEYFDKLLFSISVNDFTEFTHSMVIDKSKGDILKKGKIVYNNNTYLGGARFFIRPTYESKNEFKNKSFSQYCFAALCINDKYLNYIKSLPENGAHKYFETVFSDQGIWLIETDNKEYYKVLLFKE